MFGRVGMMGAVIWQQLQSHTGCAKLLSPYKSVAQPVALQQQISPITASAADPPITVSAADPPITVHHPLMFSATVPHNYEGHSADSSVITVFVVERYDRVP